MDPRANLYSRQQLGSLTELDDSTLNYWMREGVLRAASGGQGKGQHRRFRYEEVGLAAILKRLKAFGVSIAELRQISGFFHHAIDETDRLELGVEARELVWNLMLQRSKYLKDGYLERELDDYPNAEKVLPKYGNEMMARVSWEDEVANFRKSKSGRGLNADLLDVVEREDPDAFMWNDYLYGMIGRLPTKLYETVDIDYFWKGEDGFWKVTGDVALWNSSVDSFIGIDVDRLSFNLWSRL